MTRALAALVLAAMTLLPGAQAASAEGLFTIEGQVGLPAGTFVESPAQIVFLGGTKPTDPALDFTEFLLEADSLQVTEHNATYAAAPSVEPEHASNVEVVPSNAKPVILSNVTITLEGPPQQGYVALESQGDEPSASLDATGPVRLESLARSVFMDGETAIGGDSVDKNPTYARTLPTPHVLASAPGMLSFSGEAKMKLSGMVLTVTHDGVTERMTTGTRYQADTLAPGLPRVYEQRWVVLSGQVHFRASSPQEWKVAGSTAVAAWKGEADFHATSGMMETARAIYNLSADMPTPARLNGSFMGTLEAVQSGRVVSKMEVVGDLQETNLPVVQTKMVLPMPSTQTSFLWLGALLGAVVVGGGGYLLHRRARRATRVNPVPTPTEVEALSPAIAAEYYVGLAEQALQFGEHEKALHWITRAREASPTSSDAATTMAFILGELGRYDEALAAYEEASRLDPSSGEADLNAARLAAQAGKPLEEVEAFVVRALERSPEFVFDVEEDVEFRPLAIRASFREALARAWERWGGEEPAVSP